MLHFLARNRVREDLALLNHTIVQSRTHAVIATTTPHCNPTALPRLKNRRQGAHKERQLEEVGDIAALPIILLSLGLQQDRPQHRQQRRTRSSPTSRSCCGSCTTSHAPHQLFTIHVPKPS